MGVEIFVQSIIRNKSKLAWIAGIFAARAVSVPQAFAQTDESFAISVDLLYPAALALFIEEAG